jgi:hypothetical protein
MVTLAGLGFVIAATLAGAEHDQPPPVRLSVTAVRATLEHRPARYFDPGLESIRNAVADLEFDTYRTITVETVSAPYKRETTLPLTPRYTLSITPLSREPRGDVRLNVSILMASRQEGGRPINALATTVVTGPGKPFKLRGLRLDQGELVVVLAFQG